MYRELIITAATFVLALSAPASPFLREPSPETVKAIRKAEAEGDFSKAAAGLRSIASNVVGVGTSRHHDIGVLHFFAGEIDKSVAAFDAYLAERPERAPYSWQRGLSLYYADEFQRGREQFESHQEVNSNDVENAAFHFICVAALEGAEAARKALIPIKGDSRVPMAQLHDLFAGTGSEEQVLAAAGEDRNALCYAHLYLGLYHEALGDDAKAEHHIRLSAFDYSMDHYMGRCSQTHAKVRGWNPKEP